MKKLFFIAVVAFVAVQSGKVDSMSYLDDLKIENGKIVELDEKSRRYPVK
jgi:hypothetical protein